MARQKRLQSETGIYHVMLRGINKQKVFLCDNDYYMFLRVLSKCKTICGFKLYAYCLMSNHVHLLIQEGEEPLANTFKRFGDSFVYRYNKEHKRSGSLFEGRYKSIPVNDDEYFITVLKYIHQNPVKAGIVKNCSDYEFSSFNSYFKQNDFVDNGFALELIGVNEFIRIHSEGNDEYLYTYEDKRIKQSDNLAKEIVEKITHCSSPEEFSDLPKGMQKSYVKTLRKEGLSIKQIVRLTGVSQRRAEGR